MEKYNISLLSKEEPRGCMHNEVQLNITHATLVLFSRPGVKSNSLKRWEKSLDIFYYKAIPTSPWATETD